MAITILRPSLHQKGGEREKIYVIVFYFVKEIESEKRERERDGM
jgi:hypothetical protein